MNTLYELTDEYMAVMEMMDDPEIDEQVIADTLEAIGGEIEIKADNYAKLIKGIESTADGLKGEIERLSARERAIRNNVRRVKTALQDAMQKTGKTKFKTELFSFGIQKNPPSVDIVEGAQLPDKYLIPQPAKIDKKGIIAALKAGTKINGCTLTQSESLRIR